MNLADKLFEKYGPLLSFGQLASILDRSPEGLRVSLRTESQWSLKINAARLKVGRRVYFRTSDIATVLEGD